MSNGTSNGTARGSGARWGLRGVLFLLLAALAGVGSWTGEAQAATMHWKADADGSWNATGSWTENAIPGSGDTAIFDFTLTGDRIVTVDANRPIVTIVFNNPSAYKYTLSGGPLYLDNGGVIRTDSANGAHTDTISCAIQIQGIGGSASFTANATSASSILSIGAVTGVSTAPNTTTLTINGTNTGANAITGVIGDGSALGKLAITKDNAGSWTITGSTNSFSGGVKLQAGTMVLTTAASGYLGTGTLTFLGANSSSGGTLSFTRGGAQAVGNPVVFDTGTHTLTVPTGSTPTTFTGGVTVQNTPTLTFSTLASAITFSTAVSTLNSDLIINGTHAFAVNFTGGLTLDDDRTITLNDSGTTSFGGTLTTPTNKALTLAGSSTGVALGTYAGGGAALTGTGAVKINSTTGGVYTTRDSNASYGGGTTVVSGTLAYSASNQNPLSIGTGAITFFGGELRPVSDAAMTLNNNLVFDTGTVLLPTNPVSTKTHIFAGTVTIQNGPTLNVTSAGNRTFSGAVTFSNSGFSLIGTHTGSVAFSGGFALAGDNRTLTLNDTGAVTLSGALSSTAASNKLTLAGSNNTVTVGAVNTGANTPLLEINGTGTYTFNVTGGTATGGVTLSAGTVRVGATSPFMATTSPLTLSGGVISSDTTTARAVAHPLYINGSVTIGHATNTGALTFSNATQSISGGPTITFAGGAHVFGTNPLSLTSGATFTINAGTVLSSGGLSLNSDNRTITVNSVASTNTLTIRGALSNCDSKVLTVLGPGYVTIGDATAGVSGTAGLTLGGAGTFTMGVTNSLSTYSGGTTVTGAATALFTFNSATGTPPANGPFGTGTVTLNNGIIKNKGNGSQTLGNAFSITGGSTSTIDSVATASAGTFGVSGPLSVSGTPTLDMHHTGGGTIAVNFSGALNLADGANLTVTGGTGINASNLATTGINLSGNATITTTYTGANTLTITGTLTGSGPNQTLTLDGTAGSKLTVGALTAGTNNPGLTKTGGWTLTLGGANYIPNSLFTFNNGTLALGANNQTIAGLNGTGGTWTATTPTLTLGGNGTYSYSGAINPGTALLLTMSGSGTQTLSGANTFTGATAVSNGKLFLGGTAGAMAATPVGVTSSGTYGMRYTSGGNSKQGGSTLNLTNGTTLDLQDSNTNTMSFTGAGTLSGASLKFDLGPGGASDTLTTVGAAALTNAQTFSFAATGSSLSTSAGAYTLITATSGLNAGGTFAFASGSDKIAAGGKAYTLALVNAAASEKLTATLTADPTTAFWSGAQGSGWQCSWNTINAGNITNWTTDGTGATDTNQTPGSVTDVTFIATGGANLNTALGQDFTIKSLAFSSTASSPVTIGGSNTLTITPLSSGTGVTVDTTSGNHLLSTKVALGADQTWTVTDAAQVLTASNQISGGFALTKAGSGTVSLSLAAGNTYTGTTTINAGTLLAMNSSGSATGTGNVTVGSGGTLGGTGIISGTVGVSANGTLAPGVTAGTLATGALALTAGAGIAGSTASFEISSDTVYDKVSITGNVAFGGTLTVTTISGWTGWADGQVYDLFDWTGSPSGTFDSINLPALPGSLVWHDYGGGVLFDTTTGEIKVESSGPSMTVTLVDPSSGPAAGGTAVTVTGTGFDTSGALTMVDFGGSVATSVVVNFPTQIACTTTAHAGGGAVFVTVTNPGGASAVSTTELYTHILGAAPTDIVLDPNAGPSSGGQDVTVTGTGFASGATVTFDLTSTVESNFVSSTTLTCVAPAHAVGPVGVTVTNPYGVTSAPGDYTYFDNWEGDVAPRRIGGGAGGGDNDVSVADWVQIGRFAAKLDTPVSGIEFQKADCAGDEANPPIGDGDVSVADWVKCGRYAAKLDAKLTAQGPTGL